MRNNTFSRAPEVRMQNTTLSRAAAVGTLAQVRELLKGGANVKATNSKGTTALMWACARGNVHIVKELLDHGANASAANKDGLTSLMLAATGGFPGVVRMLIEYGADVQATAINGDTALTRASVTSNRFVITLIKNASGSSSEPKGDPLVGAVAAAD